MISREALMEFKKIWEEEYGTEISDAEAMTKAIALLTIFDAIYRPIKKEWAAKYGDGNHAILKDDSKTISSRLVCQSTALEG